MVPAGSRFAPWIETEIKALGNPDGLPIILLLLSPDRFVAAVLAVVDK